jgi:hypothetical protein
LFLPINRFSPALHKTEHKMAAMMIFKVCLFVICNSFHSLHFTFWSLGVYGEWKNLSYTNWQTSHLLLTLNSSILLITMALFSKKYREMIFSLSCSQTKKVVGNRLKLSEKCIISRSPMIRLKKIPLTDRSFEWMPCKLLKFVQTS